MPGDHDLRRYAAVAAGVAGRVSLRLTPLLSDRYDAHLLPGGQKRGLLIGMGMTEKQGGSDVLSNTTTAAPLGARGRVKPTGWWGTSGSSRYRRAMRTGAGAGRRRVVLFLPAAHFAGRQPQRHSPERLKDKLGNRSNASSEVEFQDATARLLGMRVTACGIS